jgi:hypothetical protein
VRENIKMPTTFNADPDGGDVKQVVLNKRSFDLSMLALQTTRLISQLQNFPLEYVEGSPVCCSKGDR